jgi:predicted DNA-binding transcriptional regulator YafY
MNRIDRLTAILIQLQSRRVVKAQDIAERFEISLRTVYRDVKTLEEAGVPILGEAGVGYSIMDGYRLPPVMFTLEEATAFLTAEKLIEKLTDATTNSSYKSAMYKVKAVLRSAEKEYLEAMEQHIAVVKINYQPENKQEISPLPIILRSIAERRILSMVYFANHSQENTKRTIEPVGVFYQAGYWYLIAFCYLRNDYRNFRTDRIKDLLITDQAFSKEHPALKTYLKQITREKELTQVIIRVDNDIVKHFGEQKYYNGFVSERRMDTQTEMTFLTSSVEGFAKWYLYFGEHADIVSPAGLKKRVQEMIVELSERVGR